MEEKKIRHGIGEWRIQKQLKISQDGLQIIVDAHPPNHAANFFCALKYKSFGKNCDVLRVVLHGSGVRHVIFFVSVVDGVVGVERNGRIGTVDHEDRHAEGDELRGELVTEFGAARLNVAGAADVNFRVGIKFHGDLQNF